MTDDVPASPEQRSAVVDHICELGELELLDVDSLEEATARALSATTGAELLSLLEVLPRPVRWMPAAAVLDEPRVVDVRGGRTELGQGWQLASTTVLRVAGGHLVLDLGSVSYDDVVTDIVAQVRGGVAEIIVPSAIYVVLGTVDRAGGELQDLLGTSVPIPGMPVVRVSTDLGGGVVRLRRPG